MTVEIIVVLSIVTLGFILFVTEALPIDVTAFTILGILLIAGLISPNDAIAGFSNPAVITIALLFVLSNAIQKTHVLEYLVVKINQLFNRSMGLGLTVYLLSIAVASAVVNNTAVVAIFIPITMRIAQSYRVSPSKVLIPLSYAAILGGTLTLVGTSTNLLVNSIFVKGDNQIPLGMFEFARYGAIQLVIGLAYILLLGNKLLPSRTVTSSLTKSFHMGGFLTEVKVLPDSPLVGKTCMQRGLNKNYDVTVLDILRGDKTITTNIRDTKLQAGDILFIRGALDNFLRLKEVEKVAMLTDQKLTHSELLRENNVLVECLLTDKSDLVGKSLKEVNFRRRFGCFVLAIRREGEIFRRKIAHVLLAAYDTLLVYGPREKIRALASTGDFIVMEEIDVTLRKQRFWWLSIVVILSIIALAAIGYITILKGTIIGVAILLVFGLITPNESYYAIRWQVIVLIAALIPLGQVIQTSGTADWVGTNLYNLMTRFPESIQPNIMLAVLYLITLIMTEVSSNAATAIIMTPIALTMAAKMGLDPRPFIFAICFAASSSFITPVGYQTNLMVYGPGGYKFTDYMRVGLPLSIALWITASFLIPLLWPFSPGAY
ncbi:MAG: SLC13 family permease [FCB group bacterium]|nr:SLC13 family permease [FCB group bacterium]